MNDWSGIHDEVADYYSAKLERHGPTPAGVDWNSAESQRTRFEQLATVIDSSRPYSVTDYGCGYGALYDFLRERGDDFEYVGYDLSRAMAEEATRHVGSDRRAEVVRDADDLGPADYTLASGIFNVRLSAPSDAWTGYILDTIDHMASLTREGFAFNMLTTYSDATHMRDDLYYGDPAFFFDHCKRNHSPRVALLHDYGLYEFTIRVRLQGP